MKPYNGKLTDPAKMRTVSLIKYLKWCEEYLDWCLRDDGRVNAYDRMTKSMMPYQDELHCRMKVTAGI